MKLLIAKYRKQMMNFPIRSKFGAVTSVITGVSLLLSGCQHSKIERSADLEFSTPRHWTPPESGELHLAVSSGQNWVQGFGDSDLVRLVDEAIDNNHDLRLADARLESARQQLRIVRSQQLPVFSLGLDGTVEEKNGAFFDAFTEDRYHLSIGTVWEADLWGRIRNNVSASDAEAQATAYDFQAAQHSIAANVCFTWFDLIAAKLQLDLAKDTYESYRSTAELILSRYESGIDSALDYRLALANAESAKGSVARSEELYKRYQRSLQLLLGRYPDGEIRSLSQFPEILSRVPAGLPSELLERRPDLLAAERRLLAAEANVKAAKKEHLPSITLTGATGTQTSEFKNLMDGNFDYWNLSAGLNQPLFTGGRIDAGREIAIQVYRQASISYQQTALQAFMEVEQALDAEAYLARYLEASKESALQSSSAESLAWDQYTSGLINIVTVLEAQRRSLIAKQSAIEAEKARLKNRVQLHLALGGDY